MNLARERGRPLAECYGIGNNTEQLADAFRH